MRNKKTKNRKDRLLQLKSKNIWNGSDIEYDLNDFLKPDGIVYFIGDINHMYVKIGITTSIFTLSHRFRVLQGSNPIQLKLLGFVQTKQNKKLERHLHERFKEYRRIAEWFILVPEIERYIKQNCMKIELANTLCGETYLTMENIY